MGLLDVHAKTWHAPDRAVQQQKAELHHLEDLEHEKKKRIRDQIDTLRRVQDIQTNNIKNSQALLNAKIGANARRRAISGAEDRLLARERNEIIREAQRDRLDAAAASLAVRTPRLSVGHLSPASLAVPVGTPRVRALSSNHSAATAAANALAAERAAANAATLAATPRVRAVSNIGLHPPSSGLTPLQIERMKIEQRKEALLQRERALQDERAARLRAKKSALDLAEHHRVLQQKEDELAELKRLQANERLMDREDALLREQELSDRMRRLSTANSPASHPLNGLNVPSGRLRTGHARHASTPMASPFDPDLIAHTPTNHPLNSLEVPFATPAMRSRRLSNAQAMPVGLSDGLAFPSMGSSPRRSPPRADLLSPNLGLSPGHSRSRSLSHSSPAHLSPFPGAASPHTPFGSHLGTPHLGTSPSALDREMMREAARLGIKGSTPYMGSAGRSPAMGLGADLHDRAAALARAGVSPRLGGYDPYEPRSRRGSGAGDGYDLGFDEPAYGGGTPIRSRNNSLIGGGRSRQNSIIGGGGAGFDPYSGASPGPARLRNDSLPFDAEPLFAGTPRY